MQSARTEPNGSLARRPLKVAANVKEVDLTLVAFDSRTKAFYFIDTKPDRDYIGNGRVSATHADLSESALNPHPGSKIDIVRRVTSVS
jgi:hypothetical protein